MAMVRKATGCSVAMLTSKATDTAMIRTTETGISCSILRVSLYRRIVLSRSSIKRIPLTMMQVGQSGPRSETKFVSRISKQSLVMGDVQ